MKDYRSNRTQKMCKKKAGGCEKVQNDENYGNTN